MKYRVIPTDKFKKEAKRLLKRYVSLKEELTALNAILQNDPHTGTSIGNNTYKVRLAIKNKGKGKSGGARVITYIISEDKDIYLLTIYDKSEMEKIQDKTIKGIIADIISKNK